MADPAVLSSLVTGATAILSGLVGYGTARGQRHVELKRLDIDARAAEAARRESSTPARRTVYLQYLAAVDDFAMLAIRAEREDVGNLGVWYERFHRFDTETELVGSDDVVRELREMHARVQAVFDSLPRSDSARADAAAGTLEARRAELARQRTKLVDAVRQDLGTADI